MEDLGEEVEAKVWARGRSGTVVKGEGERAASADKNVRGTVCEDGRRETDTWHAAMRVLASSTRSA